PQAYISTNIQGFFNILDATTKSNIKRFIYASSSSVYGANKDIPYRESDKSERPVSLYAATKKANELFAYSYSSIYNITTIGLRFFTVYGPWGRPDMSPFLFTSAIKDGREIKVFNHGEMLRDFTYIDDIVGAVFSIISGSSDSVSEVYNVGNSSPIRLNDFITTLERNIGKHAIRHNMPMQSGDVLATWADTAKLKRDYAFQPETTLNDGIKKYLAWYNEYYTK
ncbi:MAG: NAD-dependent epimerase/dehydratase family protein, partial [Tannerellaceae bacterium]